MAYYSIKPRTRKYVKGYEFLSFARNSSDKYGKQFLDTATKTETNASRKVIHKAGDAKGEFLENKTANAVARSYDDRIVKTKPVIDENSRNVEEVVIPPEKTKEKLNELRQVL